MVPVPEPICGNNPPLLKTKKTTQMPVQDIHVVKIELAL